MSKPAASKLQQSLEQLSSPEPIGNVHLVVTAFIDGFMYFTFMGLREWNNNLNVAMLLAHYFSWHMITDIVAYFIPGRRRHWFNLFRFIGSIQLINAVIWMWWAGVDGDNRNYHILRLASAALVMLHSAMLMMWFGPHSMQQLHGFLDYGVEMFRHGAFPFGKFHIMPLPMGLATIFCGELMYRLHFNFGIDALDAQLTSFQAGNGVTVLIKLWVLNILVGDTRKRVFTSFVVFALFWAQWPFMYKMFALAPIPYAHVMAEMVFFMDWVCNVILLCTGHADTLRDYDKTGHESAQEDAGCC